MKLKTIGTLIAGIFLASIAQAQEPAPPSPAQEEAPASQAEVPVAPQAAAKPAIKPVPAAAPAVDPENVLNLDLTTGGRVSIQMRPDAAPAHVDRIKTLARQGFYNNVIIHRVIDGFMAQTGDPEGTGQGGSTLPDLVAEFNTLPHVRGAVSMARTSDPNSANSQFFIMFMPRFTLDSKYTVFGRVISGMEFVDAIARGEPPANPARILRASIGSDNVPPLSPAEIVAMTPAAPAPAADNVLTFPTVPQQ